MSCKSSGRSVTSRAAVKVIACENTLRAQKLTRDDMLPALSYVPAGVTESFAGDVDVQRRAEEVPVAEYVALAQNT